MCILGFGCVMLPQISIQESGTLGKCHARRKPAVHSASISGSSFILRALLISDCVLGVVKVHKVLLWVLSPCCHQVWAWWSLKGTPTHRRDPRVSHRETKHKPINSLLLFFFVALTTSVPVFVWNDVLTSQFTITSPERLLTKILTVTACFWLQIEPGRHHSRSVDF